MQRRFTTLGLMAAIAGLAVLLWMLATAIRVEYDPGCQYIQHTWGREGGPDDAPEVTTTICGAPFWPQYWRRLLGRPWTGDYRCDCLDLECDCGPYRKRLGTEGHCYRGLGTRSVTREEYRGVKASLQSLKRIGLGRTPPPTIPDHDPPPSGP
jgi:hypothetical protein